MRYVEFREAIRSELRQSKDRLTWKTLCEKAGLPNDRSYGAWTKWLERKIGLKRIKKPGHGNALVWTLSEQFSSTSKVKKGVRSLRFDQTGDQI